MTQEVGGFQAPRPKKAHLAADPPEIPETARPDSGNWLFPSATAPNRGKCRDRLSELRKSRNFETPKLRKAETSKLPKPGNAQKMTQEVPGGLSRFPLLGSSRSDLWEVLTFASQIARPPLSSGFSCFLLFLVGSPVFSARRRVSCSDL